MKDNVKQLCKLMGEIAYSLRKKAGFTQQDVADYLGLFRTSIVNIERGNQQLTPINIIMYCELFKCKPTDLFPGHSEFKTELIPPVKTKKELKIERLKKQIQILESEI